VAQFLLSSKNTPLTDASMNPQKTTMAAAIATACSFSAFNAYGLAFVESGIHAWQGTGSTGVNVNCSETDTNTLGCTKEFTEIASNSGVSISGAEFYTLNETITNNSGRAWTDYHFIFAPTPGASYTLPCGTSFEYTCDIGSVYNGYELNYGTTDDHLFSLIDQSMTNMLWMYFDSPLPVGQSFDISLSFIWSPMISGEGRAGPFDGTPYGRGTVAVTQYPTIPEPGSLALAGAGLGAAGLAGLRRRKPRRKTVA
jgi:hypothetical protein